MNRVDEGISGGAVVGGGCAFIFVVVAVICLLCWGCPQYNVYTQRMDGEAKLAHAQSSKEVAVAEAKAKMEAAEMLAQAEVKRAEGVAKANKIIGDSLKGNEVYLRYLWVNNLETSKNQVIYIPTEAGMPLLEATRLMNPMPPDADDPDELVKHKKSEDKK